MIRKATQKTVILALLFLVTSMGMFAATKAEAFTYTGDKQLFPAVYLAAAATFKDAKFDSVDFYANKYVIKNIAIMELLTLCKVDLVITVENGVVKYDYINGQMFQERTKSWIDNNSWVFNDPHKFDAQMNKAMKTVLIDHDTEYERVKKIALQDFTFVYACMKDMNAISIKEFVQTVLGSVPLKITAEVFDVTEANLTLNDVSYTYRVQCSVTVAESTTAFVRHLTFWYYTNESSVARYNRGTAITVQGVVVSGERTGGTDGFTMTIVPAVN